MPLSYHIDLDSVDYKGAPLGIRLVASSGTDLLGSQGYIDERVAVRAGTGAEGAEEPWDGRIDLSKITQKVTFFSPFTTTLVEIRLNREPLPLRGINDLVFFPNAPERQALRRAEERAEELRERKRDEARREELTRQSEREVEAARKREGKLIQQVLSLPAGATQPRGLGGRS